MTEPPQFPRYADRPQDGDRQPGVHGQPYAGSTPPHGQPYGEGLPPYGYPTAYGPGYPVVPPHREPNSMALAALISGGIGLGPLALALGIMALFQIRRTGESGTWMAWTGIVLGALVTLFVLLFVVSWLIVLAYGDTASGTLTGLGTT